MLHATKLALDTREQRLTVLAVGVRVGPGPWTVDVAAYVGEEAGLLAAGFTLRY